MSRINSLGGGLQTEMTAVRMRMAHAVRKEQERQAAVTAAVAPAPLPSVQRKTLVFKPKMPVVAKKGPKPPPGPKGKTRVVLKVKVTSPALKKRLGIA